MTHAARYVGAILIAALLISTAAAQEMLSGVGDSMHPAELSLPSLEDRGDSLLLPSGDTATPENLPPLEMHDGYGHFDSTPYDLLQPTPAPIESSGTWLRRGFWYTEAEVVTWNRIWNRDGRWFAADDPDVQNPTFFLQLLGLLSTNRLLVLDGAQPGEDASVRLTLGHFLFRDQRNRDHTAEFTTFGGGDWSQDRVITSLNPFGLFVPFLIDGANRSFDGSSRQTVNYSSTYRSFEANYRVRQRMGHDQLVMDPDGCWHRAASNTFVWDYLAGLRILEMRDILVWQAEDILQLGTDGAYNIRTNNDLVGFQLGAGHTFETSRWSIGSLCKGGVYLNHATGRSTLDYTNPAGDDNADDFDYKMGNDELAFIGEAKLLGRWHLTPNFSLRASYEMMYITSTALAPAQATFIPEFSALATTGDPFYHGASFGFEAYW